MFPAYVGMSPGTLAIADKEACVPRIRGDEPVHCQAPPRQRAVFPAYVGMSPALRDEIATLKGVPRIRGDEPAYPKYVVQGEWCSPHTWG